MDDMNKVEVTITADMSGFMKSIATGLRDTADSIDPEYEIDGDMMPWSDVLGHVQRLHQHITEAESAMKELALTKEAQPAPIAVGDYVRLVGDRWGGEHQPDAGTCHEVKGIYPNDGQPYFDWGTARMFTHPDEYERITVTADLDEPWNLPMPEVGEHGWFYSRGTGHVSGLVSNSVGRAVYVDGFGYVGSFLRTVLSDYQITAWGTYDPADLTPAEPTTFGYVGYVTDADGDVWDVMRDKDAASDCMPVPYRAVRRRDGEDHPPRWASDSDGDWPDVLALGTFTAVER